MQKEPGPIRRFCSRHPRVIDSLVAAVATLPGLPNLVGTLADRPWIGVGLTSLAVGAAILMALFRRGHPLVIVAAGLVLYFVGIAFNFLGLAAYLTFAMYGLGAYGRRHQLTKGLAGAIITAALAALLRDILARAGLVPPMTSTVAVGDQPTFESAVDPISATLQGSIPLVISFLIGRTIGNRRAYLSALIDRTHALARERDQREQLATVTERARIAREMHDIVSHGLTVMTTLADGAASTARQNPARAEESMRAVADVGRDALGEMRRMLGVLHEPEQDLDLAPQPSLNLFHPVLRGELVWSAGVVTRQGPSSLAW